MINEIRKNNPITYVLFGATGNLAQLKIVPALCSLFEQNILNTNSKIIAFGRREWGDEEYQNFLRPSISKFNENLVSQFLDCVIFVNGTFDDPLSFERLKSKIKTEQVFYHLAVLPNAYAGIINSLGNATLKGKLLIEKPFGSNLQSARELEELIEQFFKEEDILRIDHYLGKKGLQEIINKRKNDSFFESKLNGENISKIVCRLREVIDIQGRGEFYDKTGAFIDVGQNHALELVATLLMDLNKNTNEARTEVIESFELTTQSLIKGQYEGYKGEKGVSPESTTETYFRFALQSKLPKYNGIEIIIEAGKALEKGDRKEEIQISYNNGESFVFDVDTPKNYNAYEAVIEAAIKGNTESFVSKKEIFALWKFADKIVSRMNNVPLIYYKKGEGPNFN